MSKVTQLAERLAREERTEALETAILAMVKHSPGRRILVPAAAAYGLSPRDSMRIEVTDEGILLEYALDGEVRGGAA